MKLLCFLAFAFSRCCNIYSQDSILLHTAFLPMHIYDQTIEQKFHEIMSYSDSDSARNITKEKGNANRAANERSMIMKAIITTGSFNINNEMPVQLEFIKSEDEHGKSMIPPGTKMVGIIMKDKMPAYDSVVSDEMDEETKQFFLKTFKNIFSQIVLPSKKMAVGDTLNYILPLNFPVGSITFKLLFSTTYKLVGLNDKAANFNIDIKYTIDADNEMDDVSGGGKGSGVMVIDRRNEYPLKYISDYYMNLRAVKNGVSIHAMLDGSSDSENVIRGK